MILLRLKEYSWFKSLFKKSLDLKELSKAGSYLELKDIAQDTLGNPIGEGFGRIVYIDGNKALKIATTEAGMALNRVEWKNIYLVHISTMLIHIPNLNYDYDKYFPKIYDSDPSGKWLLMEKFEDFLTFRGPLEISKWKKYPEILKDLGITKPENLESIIDHIYETGKVNLDNPFEKAIDLLRHNGLHLDDIKLFGIVYRNDKPLLVFADLGLDKHTAEVYYRGGRKHY